MAPTLQPGPFGKYRLIRRIASGGMAHVYLARLEGTAGFAKQVVLKIVHEHLAREQRFIDMFLDEGRLAARLSHPSIAQTFELGEHQGHWYIAMEYVDGATVQGLLLAAEKRRERVPLGSALRIVSSILEALEYAHGLVDERDKRPLGIVHRDVTPTNVMVTSHGGVKLLDFGIARAESHFHRTEVGTIRGKYGYMAPEQFQIGSVDRRADVFAVGSILYLLTTGQVRLPAAARTNFSLLVNAVAKGEFARPRALRPDLHVELEQVILKALATNPAQRYFSAAQMLADVEWFTATRVGGGALQLGEWARQLIPEVPLTEDEAREEKTEHVPGMFLEGTQPAQPGWDGIPSIEGGERDRTSLTPRPRPAPRSGFTDPGGAASAVTDPNQGRFADPSGLAGFGPTDPGSPSILQHPWETVVSPVPAGVAATVVREREGEDSARSPTIEEPPFTDEAAPPAEPDWHAPPPVLAPPPPQPRPALVRAQIALFIAFFIGAAIVAIAAALVFGGRSRDQPPPPELMGPITPVVKPPEPRRGETKGESRGEPRPGPATGSSSAPPRAKPGIGWIKVSCDVEASVKVNGVDLGAAPAFFEGTAGEHTFVVEELGGGRKKKVRLAVKAGETREYPVKLGD